MILPQTFGAVLFVTILSIICWGLWANTFKMAGKWRFELFYFDFAIGATVAALIYVFTFGNLGFDGFLLMDDVLHAGKRQLLYAFGSGMLFNLGNMLLLAAISVAGMTVAIPAGVGLALIVSGIWSYLGAPHGSAALLASGCGVLMVSTVVGALSYRRCAVQAHEVLARSGKAKSTRRPAPVKGVVLALAGGIFLGLFQPLLATAREGEVGLGPYAAGLFFVLGVVASTFVFNVFLMNLPVEGEPVEFREFFSAGLKQHVLGWLGGGLWMTAMMAGLVASNVPDQFRTGDAVNYGMAGGALVASLSGLIVWREFKTCDARVKALATLSIALFVVGAAMVGFAPAWVNPR